MTNFLRNITVLAGLIATLPGFAQSTTSSPYSQFGMGLISGSQLTEGRSMGGIAAGFRRLTSYSSINLANPASYSAVRLTTFDIGVYGGNSALTKGNASESTFDAALNHLAFAMPVTPSSAISFGLVPYSAKGYNFTSAGTVATNPVNYVYEGDGGISKAYIGYGFSIGKQFSLGANASYLFGKLEESRAAEYDDPAFLSSRTATNTSISGLTFDYGVQYETPVNRKVSLVLGYSGSSNSKINSRSEILTTRYFKDVATGLNTVAIDTTFLNQNAKVKIRLPLMHTLGFVLQRENRWLFGVDARMGQWANYRSEDGTSRGLKNAFGVSAGTQFIPDFTSVGKYFHLVDYRFGVRYDKTYISPRGQDIKEMAFSLGLGLPLPANRSTFYKVNLGAELGQRGTTSNNLVRERFVNVFLSFTMNDQWFQKYKFD
jgi:long-subunit fatty acid transport protein